MPKILKSERLILRELTTDDAGDLTEVLSDPRAMRFYPAPFDSERVLRWIQWNLDSYRQHGYGLWAVILKQTGNSESIILIAMMDLMSKRLEKESQNRTFQTRS